MAVNDNPQGPYQYVEVAPQVAVENDTLTVTVERQIASFGDHTTVRAHVSTGFQPAGADETVEVYQARIRGAVNTLATPLKVAVLTELGREFEVRDGIVLEVLDVPATEGVEAEPVARYDAPTTRALPVKEWVVEGGRNKLVPMPAAPRWVQPAASQYEWAAEVIHGQRNDGKGDYFKVTDGQRNGRSEFINPPRDNEQRWTNTEANEPF